MASILLTLSVVAALTGANYAMYQSLHWVVPVALSLLLAGALFLFNLVWGYLFEYRKGRAMVNLFGEYVAPELVAEMAANPRSYSMEGESRELTVLFADVRGFTTISEGLDPNALREYINLYLTAVSEDIRGNRGTLDKYMGDAVMAFWGAPDDQPDHAERACRAALAIDRALTEDNRVRQARGLAPVHLRVGIHSGSAVAARSNADHPSRQQSHDRPISSSSAPKAGTSDLLAHARRGGRVLGICAGYQMLGNAVLDPGAHRRPPGLSPRPRSARHHHDHDRQQTTPRHHRHGPRHRLCRQRLRNAPRPLHRPSH